MWALFELDAWVGTYNYLFEGEDVESIVEQLLDKNNLYCISNMGRSMGTESDQAELDKISEFLDKYGSGDLTWDDLKNFEFHISTGSHRCIGMASEPDEVERLKEQAHRGK
jgi:hypothetical protein